MVIFHSYVSLPEGTDSPAQDGSESFHHKTDPKSVDALWCILIPSNWDTLW